MAQRIAIQIREKIATCLSEISIVCGNSDYIVDFSFDEEWNEHSFKTARFIANGEYTDVVFEGNECSMPIILKARMVSVGVFAGNLSTSTPAILACKPGILDENDIPAPPKEDVYAQIMKILNDLDDAAGLTEEEVRALIAEGGGGGLTKDEIKNLIASETEGKVDKVENTTDTTQAYVALPNGKQGTVEVCEPHRPNPRGIPTYDDGDALAVGEPFEENHAVPKMYLEEYAMPMPYAIADRNYGDGSVPSQAVSGLIKRYDVRGGVSDVNGARYTIPLRTINGCVTTLTPVDAKDAANKGYVDDLTAPIAENTNKITDHEKRIENLESTLLTFIEDTATAYEKDVPVGVGENAVLSSIGGATVSNNLLDPNRIHADDEYNTRVNDDGSVNFSWDFGEEEHYYSVAPSIELPIGTYYLNYYVKVVGNPNASYTVAFENGTNVMEVAEEGQSVYIVLNILGSGYCSADYYVMLSTDPDAEFESFFDGTNYGKVTAVESYGSNLFNIDGLKGFTDSANVTVDFDNKTINCVGGNAAHIARFNTTEDFFNAFNINEVGTYRFAANAHFDIYIYKSGTQILNINPWQKPFEVTQEFLDKVNNLEGGYYITIYVIGKQGESYGDLRITKSTDALPYHPYSAEPIDTFTIPHEIQEINGHGKDGFVLDFESKTTEYEGETTDVSQYLTGYDKFKTIKVQGGGKVRFVSEDGLPVPSEITYVKAKE